MRSTAGTTAQWLEVLQRHVWLRLLLLLELELVQNVSPRPRLPELEPELPPLR